MPNIKLKNNTETKEGSYGPSVSIVLLQGLRGFQVFPDPVRGSNDRGCHICTDCFTVDMTQSAKDHRSIYFFLLLLEHLYSCAEPHVELFVPSYLLSISYISSTVFFVTSNSK